MSRSRNFVVKPAAVNASGTLLSRITGFARDLGLAYSLGAGVLVDVFVVAFRFPNLFRRVFAEGAFHAAFVPLFAEEAKKSKPQAQVFAAQVLWFLVAALFVLCAGAMAGMDWFIYLIAQGFRAEPDKLALAITYSRFAFPYLFFMGLVALFGAMLNARGHFATTAYAPILLNIILLGAIWGFHIYGGFPLDWLMAGVVLAGAVQAFVVIALAYRAGLGVPLLWQRPKLSPKHKQFFTLFLPGMIAASFGQINLLVGTSIATAQASGAAWLYYAERVFQLPLGLIGVGLGVALLPALSRQLATKQTRQAQATQQHAIGLALYLALPATLGLFLLALPIVRTLFAYGAFTLQDATATAIALQAFVWGLPALVLIKLLQPIFFAHKDTISPMKDGAVGAVVNITLALVLFGRYGYVAIAIATSVAAWVSFALMFWRVHRLGYWVMPENLWRYSASVGLGLGVMWLYLSLYGEVFVFGQDLWQRVFWLAGAVMGGAVSYVSFGASLWMPLMRTPKKRGRKAK